MTAGAAMNTKKLCCAVFAQCCSQIRVDSRNCKILFFRGRRWCWCCWQLCCYGCSISLAIFGLNAIEKESCDISVEEKREKEMLSMRFFLLITLAPCDVLVENFEIIMKSHSIELLRWFYMDQPSPS